MTNVKTAFVTGASTGLGKRVALETAKRGYFVFIAGRNTASLEDVKKQIISKSRSVGIVILDLLSLRSIKNAAQMVKNKRVKLDILANIAGMYHDEKQHFFNIPFEKYPDEAIIKNINASLVGHILLTKYFTPLMNNSSCVVNMSGTFDEGETGVISDYVTKHAIEIFSKQLSLELKDKGVRSNCIRPGFVFTESVQKFFPSVRSEEALNPEALASKIVDIAENIEINGEVIEITKNDK